MSHLNTVYCPICGTDNVRSKVCDADGTWWYVCDEQRDDPHELMEPGSDPDDPVMWNLSTKRWYFNAAGLVDSAGHNRGVIKIINVEEPCSI